MARAMCSSPILNNRVFEVPANGGAQTTVGSGLFEAYGVAVDGAGDVFIADSYNASRGGSGRRWCADHDCQRTDVPLALRWMARTMFSSRIPLTTELWRCRPTVARRPRLPADCPFLVASRWMARAMSSSQIEATIESWRCRPAAARRPRLAADCYILGIAVDGAGDVFISDNNQSSRRGESLHAAYADL